MGGLLQRAGMEVAIHVDAAERAFYGIDLAVLIPIQLLEVIMGEIQGLRMKDSRGICRRTWIVALRILEHAVVHQIGPRLDHGLRDGFLQGLHRAMAFPSGRSRVRGCRGPEHGDRFRMGGRRPNGDRALRDKVRCLLWRLTRGQALA